MSHLVIEVICRYRDVMMKCLTDNSHQAAGQEVEPQAYLATGKLNDSAISRYIDEARQRSSTLGIQEHRASVADRRIENHVSFPAERP